MKITGDFVESVLSKHNGVFNRYREEGWEDSHYNPHTGVLTKYYVKNGQLIQETDISQGAINECRAEAQRQREYHGTLAQKMAIRDSKEGAHGGIDFQDLAASTFGATPLFHMPVALLDHILRKNFGGEEYKTVRDNPFQFQRFKRIINSDYKDFITNPTGKI